MMGKRGKSGEKPPSVTGSFSFCPYSIPDRLICYLSPAAVRNLSREEALGVAQRLGKSCPWSRGMPGGRDPSSSSPHELQVSPGSALTCTELLCPLLSPSSGSSLGFHHPVLLSGGNAPPTAFSRQKSRDLRHPEASPGELECV